MVAHSTSSQHRVESTTSAFHELEGPHSGENIVYDIVLTVLREYEISDKQLGNFVLDNALLRLPALKQLPRSLTGQKQNLNDVSYAALVTFSTSVRRPSFLVLKLRSLRQPYSSTKWPSNPVRSSYASSTDLSASYTTLSSMLDEHRNVDTHSKMAAMSGTALNWHPFKTMQQGGMAHIV